MKTTIVSPAYIHATPEAGAGSLDRLKEYAADLGIVITLDESHPDVAVPEHCRIYSRKELTAAYEGNYPRQ